MIFGGTRSALKSACEQLRSELDDHLEAINANTGDIVEAREIVGHLDDKIERLASRIDELYLLLGAENKLTTQEAALEAFLQLPRTLEDVAVFCGLSQAGAQRAVHALYFKGIAVHQIARDDVVLLTTNQNTTKNISLNSYL